MKRCILKANLEGQGWQSRLFTILLLTLTMELKYPQKRRVNRKRGGSFRGYSAWEGGQMTYLGEGRVCLGDQGYGETIQTDYRMNFIQGCCQRFSPHFKSTLHWLHTKNTYFSRISVFFGSLFSVMRHNSPVLFHLKLYMLWTKRAHQSANFQTFDCSHEN